MEETTVQTDAFNYLEQTVKRMVEALKQKGCLDGDFAFLTQEEQSAAVEDFIDEFIKTEALPNQTDFPNHL